MYKSAPSQKEVASYQSAAVSHACIESSTWLLTHFRSTISNNISLQMSRKYMHKYMLLLGRTSHLPNFPPKMLTKHILIAFVFFFLAACTHSTPMHRCHNHPHHHPKNNINRHANPCAKSPRPNPSPMPTASSSASASAAPCASVSPSAQALQLTDCTITPSEIERNVPYKLAGSAINQECVFFLPETTQDREYYFLLTDQSGTVSLNNTPQERFPGN